MHRLAAVMKRDTHAPNGCRVTSLYFDDIHATAYTQKVAGVLEREKYRIRAYDGKDAIIKLERKRRAGMCIIKSGERINRMQYDQIISGDDGFLIDGGTLAREFYGDMKSSGMTPAAVVDYWREAYVDDFGVRVTLDSDLRYAPGEAGLFGRGNWSQTLTDGHTVLEVKYSDYLPLYVRMLLTDINAQLYSVSKYALSIERLLERVFYV